MRVYIAGPIAGFKDGNRAAFEMYADVLGQQGHQVVNPHELDHGHTGRCRGAEVPRHVDEPASEHRYGCYMRADIRALLECDAALFLPGCTDSKGASVERRVAQICGLQIMEYWQIQEITG